VISNKSKKIVALVPMKGHSERVPGKNFREFAGKPLFRWIIDTLLAVPRISKIVINTDAADLFKKHGLTESDRIVLRERKAELCGDDMSMNRVLEDDVRNIAADYYLMTHSTNPLLTKATIESAIEAFESAQSKQSHDSLFSVNKYQTRFYKADATPINHNPNNLIPTQNLEPWYEENSNIYLFTKSSFESTSARIGSKPMIFVTPPMESSDIDTVADWEQAEVKAVWMNKLK